MVELHTNTCELWLKHLAFQMCKQEYMDIYNIEHLIGHVLFIGLEI